MSTDGRSPRSIATRPEHVFGDQRPFAQCHASTLVEVLGGGILVAWFGGTREAHRDVGIWAAHRKAPPKSSSDGSAPGENWSNPRLIAKTSDEAHWNPVLFALTPDGSDVVLHFKVGARIRDWETWSQHSTDGGQTWTAARPLVAGDRGGRGAVRNKPIRLASGHWLAGASLERWKRWDAFIDRSPNGLDGWIATKEIQIDRSRFSGKGLIQPSLWESAPGHAHALFRTTDGRVYRSDSNDDGESWTRAYPIDLPNNNSGLDVVRLRSGLLALACNPVEGNWADRTPLSVVFSRDNGFEWSDQIDLETDPGEFSYPAIIEVEDGLAISYTWNRRRIAVARLGAAEIPSLGRPDLPEPLERIES
jgi:predicted neuraminidase